MAGAPAALIATNCWCDGTWPITPTQRPGKGSYDRQVAGDANGDGWMPDGDEEGGTLGCVAPGLGEAAAVGLADTCATGLDDERATGPVPQAARTKSIPIAAAAPYARLMPV